MMRLRFVASWLVLFCVACAGRSSPAVLDQGEQSTTTSVSDETAAWLLEQARARLGDGQTRPSAKRSETPHEAVVSRPTTLFVTIFVRGRATSPPAVGSGERLQAALSSALDALGAVRAGNGYPDRIRIDVLDGSRTPIEKPNQAASANSRIATHTVDLIDVGRDGIAVESGGRISYLLPADMIYGSIVAEEPDEQTAEDFLNRVMTHVGLGQGDWRSPDVKLSRFRTVSVAEAASDGEPLRLVRGFTVADEPDRSALITAARAGGDYLLRTQRPDGSFTYVYDPLENRSTSRAYNIVRHAGTAFSLFDLYATTHDHRYLEAGRQATTFLKTRFQPAQGHNAYYVLDNDGKAKLGANGLGLLALTRQAELDPRSADRSNAKRLANMIVAMQNQDGSFESYYPLRGDDPAGSVSLYYPGEAILGLVSLFKLTGDQQLLESARKGADNVIDSQRRAAELPPDAWLMQALDALYQLGREQRYLDHSIALAEAMMVVQYPDDAPPGYAGGFGPGIPRTTPAAARSEGLLAAYRLARSVGDPRASAIKSSLHRSARFQLSQQFNADNSFFLVDPAKALGGFRGGPTSMDIRIDFVQHNISSLLGVANVD
jgi:hypothetical protein